MFWFPYQLFPQARQEDANKYTYVNNLNNSQQYEQNGKHHQRKGKEERNT